MSPKFILELLTFLKFPIEIVIFLKHKISANPSEKQHFEGQKLEVLKSTENSSSFNERILCVQKVLETTLEFWYPISKTYQEA